MTLGGVQVGKRERQVREREATAAAQRQECQVAQAPSHPRTQPDRQGAEERREQPERYVGLRLRSRRTSTTIGITESTMTTITTMWMCLLMFGMTWPSR